MIACEELRGSVTYAELRDECLELTRRFAEIRTRLNAPDGSGANYAAIVPKADFFEYQMFLQNESLTRKLLSVAGGQEWFTHFMTDWITGFDPAVLASSATPSASSPNTLAGGNLYDDANFRLNLLIKRTVGRLVVRNAELTASRAPASLWAQDERRRACLSEADMLNNYAFLLDRRNMPVFPANGSDGKARYIPHDEYFMMGDNRFNSLDMRHSYEDTLQPLTRLDPMPMLYYSNMDPQSVKSQSILGSPVLRVWPWARKGIPGVTGKKKSAAW
jgi:signal peptidase I